MLKNNSHNIESKSKSSNVLLISYFFIIVCFISLCLQNQNSFLGLNKSFSQKIAFLTEVKNAKYPSQFHYSEFPSIESVITINQLEDSEDDNERSVSRDYLENNYQQFSKNEHNYSSMLRSRYMQFALLVHNKSDIPFFILHHSWKSYIS